MRFVHRVLVAGLALSISAPVFAARQDTKAPPAVVAKRGGGAQRKASGLRTSAPAAKVGKTTKSALDLDTSPNLIDDRAFARLNQYLDAFGKGVLPSTFVDRAHTERVDRVDLEAMYQTFRRDPAYQAYEDAARAQEAWKQQNRAIAHTVANIPERTIVARDEAFRRIFNEFPELRDNMYSVGEMAPNLRRDYPLPRKVPERTVSSLIRAAVAELDTDAKAYPQVKKMLAAARANPLTMALVLQVGERGDTGASKGNPHVEVARYLYNAVSKILHAADRENNGPGLVHIFPNEGTLSHFQIHTMGPDNYARKEQILSLPREQIMSAARGVFTKAELNAAINGLAL